MFAKDLEKMITENTAQALMKHISLPNSVRFAQVGAGLHFMCEYEVAGSTDLGTLFSLPGGIWIFRSVHNEDGQTWKGNIEHVPAVVSEVLAEAVRSEFAYEGLVSFAWQDRISA